MLWHLPEIHPFLLLSIFCGYPHFYTLINWCPRFFPLWHSDELVWLCEEVICGHVLSCSLSIDLELEFLGHMVTLNSKF